jgi:transposase-like protein
LKIIASAVLFERHPLERMVRWRIVANELSRVHKTANVLNRLPKPKAKRALQEIWMAETKKDALAAFDAFVEAWGVKYDKAVECLTKDREALLAFYDFPAEHWKHLRTTSHNQLPKVIIGVRFADGIEIKSQAQVAAA